MSIKFPGGRSRFILSFIGVCLVAGFAWAMAGTSTEAGPQGDMVTVEKMIVATGTVSMELETAKLNGARSRAVNSTLRFTVQSNAFFTIIVSNDELRGSLPSSMDVISETERSPVPTLQGSLNQLAIESLAPGGEYELAVRDSKSGFIYFYVEGHEVNFEPTIDNLSIKGGRLLVSPEYAAKLGRLDMERAVVGTININANMHPIEVNQVVNGEVVGSTLPAIGPDAGTRPGPDVVVGDVIGLAQFGSELNGFVGLALGTDSCNYGTVNLNWFALPNNDHPVIPQNLYRMSGGADNAERFEQVGQSQMKHGFTALTQNLCGLGCNGVGGSQLGSGCSDPYSASLNAGPNLGSRAWVNPYTGFFPRGDSGTSPNDHTGHNHNSAPLHRILTRTTDLAVNQNTGATYYAEGQYVTPHEYAWCQANPTQCNMNNNVSWRRYNVSGNAAPFSFSANGSTQREQAAIRAWTGASFETFEPAPRVDGIGIVGYKVSQPSPGVYQYEYAIYNQNLDRGIRTFAIPLFSNVVVTDVGFYAPPQHPGSTFDGTAGNAGYSSAPWVITNDGSALRWETETLAQNPNANAIRWGTMYNFRFRSTAPPLLSLGVIGFYKTGNPITVRVPIPAGGNPACSRVPDGARCL
jgi:hypothetical protein